MVTVVVAGILWLWQISALEFIWTPFLDVNLLGISLVFSIIFVVYLAVWAFYGAWQARLVISEVWNDRAEPAEAFREAPRWFFRTLLIEFIGHGAILLAMGPIHAIGTGSIVVVSYTSSTSDGGSSTINHVSKTEWGVNGSWTGGYPTTLKW